MGALPSHRDTDIARLALAHDVVPKYTKPFHVYLDVRLGRHAAGRLVLELRGDLFPLAAENFRRLCVVARGGYAGTALHLPVVVAREECGIRALRSRPSLACYWAASPRALTAIFR